MTADNIMTGILIGVLVVCAILAGISLAGVDLPPPASWLQAWTRWIATVVGIVVSAKVLLWGMAVFQKYAKP